MPFTQERAATESVLNGFDSRGLAGFQAKSWMMHFFEPNYRPMYAEQTCLRLFDQKKLMYGSIDFYQTEGYSIIEFDEIVNQTSHSFDDIDGLL